MSHVSAGLLPAAPLPTAPLPVDPLPGGPYLGLLGHWEPKNPNPNSTP